MKTVIKLSSVRWAPYSKYGYASGRLMTIAFPDKKDCDDWVFQNNNSYPGCTQYTSLPYLTGENLLEAEIAYE